MKKLQNLIKYINETMSFIKQY